MTIKLTRAGRTLALASALASMALPSAASAFCGFYVTGADQNLYANATMVVLMRDGTRTVLSMQNNYQGPPEAFALVIPVPTVLQKDQVKVLPSEVFSRVDTLGAPRLVEYWEMDPCYQPPPPPALAMASSAAAGAPSSAGAANRADSAVRIEAQFAVGEYDVVILSADDSSALDTWLRDNKYNIPAGAQPVLAPYVAAGMKFFVAKVDPMRVKFNGDQAALSPLRFHYDSSEFSLPVRLGLLNSQGSQDLIVNILATKRYELTNYKNISVPTNIRVRNEVRDDFASFYEALFSRAVDQNPGAVVTEYSWSAGSCDPCPTPPLSAQDIATLGGDVLQTAATQPQTPNQSGRPAASAGSLSAPYSFTLTRLHARYTKDNLGEDLIFQPADGIMGGRGIPDQKGALDQSVQTAGYSNFQGRYVILHPWEKALTCNNPVRGRWGGPPAGTPQQNQTQAPANRALMGAAPKAGDLPALLAESLPALSVDAKSPLEPVPGLPITGQSQSGNGIKTMPPAAPSVSTTSTSTKTGSAGSASSTSQSVRFTDPGQPRDEGRSSGGCNTLPRQRTNPLAPGLFIVGLIALVLRSSRRRDQHD